MVSSSRSDAPPFGRTATVVGNGSHVANERDSKAGLLKGTKGALAPGAWTLDEHCDRTHAVLHRAARGFFGGELSGEGSALARALEPTRTRACPRDGRAVQIGDGDDRVVERRLDVNDAGVDVLANDLFLRAGSRRRGGGSSLRFFLRGSHGLIFHEGGAARRAMLFRGPLRVRAFVRVR